MHRLACSSRRKEALSDARLAEYGNMEPPYVGCYGVKFWSAAPKTGHCEGSASF